MMIGRRQLLAGSAAWLAGPALASNNPPGPDIPPWPPAPARPRSLLDQMIGTVPPRLEMVCPHTGENWSGWFFNTAAGHYDHAALNSLEWFVRDWRESIRVKICVRLYWSLAAATHDAVTSGSAGVVELLSGYRTPRTNASLPNAARDSFHMYGRAMDIRIPGIGVERLADYMEHLEVGGVGRYRDDGFVHIDSGRVRRWSGQA